MDKGCGVRVEPYRRPLLLAHPARRRDGRGESRERVQTAEFFVISSQAATRAISINEVPMSDGVAKRAVAYRFR